MGGYVGIDVMIYACPELDNLGLPDADICS